MSTSLASIAIKPLQELVDEYQELCSKSEQYDALDVFPTTKVLEIKTRSIAAIVRTSGQNSVYYAQSQAIITEEHTNNWDHLPGLIGILQALIIDIQGGYIASLAELIHGEIFSDYLEMATYLCGSNYKDAAAVIAGSTLESHIKQLCIKANIPTETTIASGDVKPKKADLMNSELAKAAMYSKTDQKTVTAWLGLRNEAAHGNYSAYTKEQVALMIDSIRNFIIRTPA